ncbi:MAG TPA: phosphoglucosamine mutase [Acidimicrobiales bacterium]|nr:phosphoglucosamine mutase [Acidimicrobiales bacterium]
MRLAFGTDGVRGVANSELSPELALAIGRAAARILGRDTFLVGRDTRRSGPLLQAAFSAGLASEGADVVDLGVIPTPGVACIAARRGLPAAVISASHNPFPDNGVKLLGPGGTKLDEDIERSIEAELGTVLAGPAGSHELPSGDAVGRITGDEDAGRRYLDRLRESLAGRTLTGLRVVVDCANGAASGLAPGLLESLGAEVTVLSAAPDGVNINAGCGSTHPQSLQEAVVAAGADVGLALDGDADRVVAVDERGRLVDGDHLMAMSALDLRDRGLLAGNTVVVTVMSNLGFRRAMEAADLAVHETPVGDRHVLAAMETHGWVLGGEQSGHIIFRHLASTGDGMLTGLQVLDLVQRRQRSLGELAAESMTRMPQELRSVRVADLSRLDEAPAVWDAVAETERSLGHRGRVVLRASGTEPVVRVMVEADDPGTAASAVDRLCHVVEQALGVA